MNGLFVLFQLILLGGWSDFLIVRASFYRDQRNVNVFNKKKSFLSIVGEETPPPFNLGTWITGFVPWPYFRKRSDLHVNKNRNSQTDVRDL